MGLKAKGKTPKTNTPKVASDALTRRTITLSAEMEAAIDALVGRRKFSAFAQQAFAHELQRESIALWLDEREAARGGKPLDADAIAFAERSWRARK